MIAVAASAADTDKVSRPAPTRYAALTEPENDSGGSTYVQLRDAVRLALDDPQSSRCASVVHYFVIVLIAASAILAIIQTVPEYAETYEAQFDFLEMAFTASFTLEILIRLWTTRVCTAYFSQISNMVDVVATLPWYLEQGLDRFAPGSNRHSVTKLAGSMRTLRMVRLVRMVRLLRVLRLAKAARHSETISTVFESIWDSLEGIFVLVFLVGLGAVLSATLVYAMESEDDGGKFRSIPSSMWWSMATITTVGYGDVVPATTMGKVIACATMVIGMIIVSVSVAAITTSFTDSYNRRMAFVKIAKSIKKARVSASFPAGDEASTAHSADLSLPAASSFRSLVDRGQLDLVSMFATLEEDTKQAMMRLEHSVSEMVHAPKFTGEASLPLNGKRGSLMAPKSNCAMIALQVLQDQRHTFFKSAMSLAEQVVEAEADQRAAQ